MKNILKIIVIYFDENLCHINKFDMSIHTFINYSSKDTIEIVSFILSDTAHIPKNVTELTSLCAIGGVTSIIDCIISYDTHQLRTKNYNGNRNCHVTSVHTYPNHRHLGYATKLIQHIKKICVEYSVKTIFLDDCSSNFMQSNNLYSKNGFVYLNRGLPEMIFVF